MAKLKTLKNKWLKDPKVKGAYKADILEFTIAKKLVSERLEAKLTQQDLAKNMGTTQSVIARL